MEGLFCQFSLVWCHLCGRRGARSLWKAERNFITPFKQVCIKFPPSPPNSIAAASTASLGFTIPVWLLLGSVLEPGGFEGLKPTCSLALGKQWCSIGGVRREMGTRQWDRAWGALPSHGRKVTTPIRAGNIWLTCHKTQCFMGGTPASRTLLPRAGLRRLTSARHPGKAEWRWSGLAGWAHEGRGALSPWLALHPDTCPQSLVGWAGVVLLFPLTMETTLPDFRGARRWDQSL